MIVPLKYYKSHGVLKGLFILIKISISQLLMFPFLVFLSSKRKEVLNFEVSYPRLKEDEKGKNICISCKLCSKICPTDAITIKASKNSQVDMTTLTGDSPESFIINHIDCVQCRLCISICPVSALTKDFAQEL